MTCMETAWSVRALVAGKHVLCEKPLCLTADEVQKLCEVRDRTRLWLPDSLLTCSLSRVRERE